MKLLTIVVPAYNAEPYLKRCLDSVCCRPLLDQMQIIVVNDGSRDGTSLLAHRYEQAFPDAVMVIDKENGGHGSGINAALPHVCGKYFRVLDADDWVLSENLPALLAALQQSSADMVLCHFDMVDVYSGEKRVFRTAGIPFDKTYSFSEFMAYPREAYTCCFFHGILYRTEFYRTTGIRLSEKTFYEDQEFATLPACYAKTVLPLDLVLYQYAVGSADQSVSDENQVRNLGQIEKVFWNICRFYCAHRDMEEAKRRYFLFKLSMLLQSYCVAALLKDRDRRRGRAAAVTMCRAVRETCPELYAQFGRRYLALRILHGLHVSPAMFERLLACRRQGRGRIVQK